MVRQFVLSFFVFVVVLIALPSSLLATHNRAGEISIEQVGDCVSSLTVKATIVTYSKASSPKRSSAVFFPLSLLYQTCSSCLNSGVKTPCASL